MRCLRLPELGPISPVSPFSPRDGGWATTEAAAAAEGKAVMATLSNEKENKRETLLSTCGVGLVFFLVGCRS